MRTAWALQGGHERGKLFAFCPMDSVRGRVHVVPANPLLELVHPEVSYKIHLADTWETRLIGRLKIYM